LNILRRVYVYSEKTDMNKVLDIIFSRLWSNYIHANPSAGRIYDLFKSEGEDVVNDHIAFRTIDLPEVNIDVIEKPFIRNGYEPRGEYHFESKHLYAKHYELPGDPSAPRVFISQLKTNYFTDFLQCLFRELINSSPKCTLMSPELIFMGSIFEPLSHEKYLRLLEESEYAAWFYVFGFRANHFTVSVNHLKKNNDIYKVNELLKKNGYLLNGSGGEVKGTPEELLQQSSTMADIVKVKFIEGEFDVPCCYYEFAQRFTDKSGELYSGFIAKSADKIFESTNFYKKPEK
jgi:Domain of unknown function (DUF1338)